MDEPLLQVRDLTKTYTQHRFLSRKRRVIPALRGVCLSVRRGCTLALVGESGSGKSTLARCVTRLEDPTSGEIWFGDTELASLDHAQLRPFRPKIQLLIQGSGTAISPYLRAWEVVEEPLRIQQRGTAEQAKGKALEMMQQVGLPETLAERRPHEFSGGQRQRLAIARALVLDPELLVLDEPFVGLDVSVQAQIANLLLALQEERSLTYLLIAHDLALASSLADDIAVIHSGIIIESATPSEILQTPRQPYTTQLVAAVCRPGARRSGAGGAL
ncbi:MAG TPA: ABC transporter ATP-binding protein [Candidatus Methylomirabilis sp.]|nr:ABC transporter ATP-binding protein [Candidatus Methylomirabilis sp.]